MWQYIVAVNLLLLFFLLKMTLINLEECFISYLCCDLYMWNFAPSAEHFANGYISESSMLWAEGRSEWMPLSSIPDLLVVVTKKDQPDEGY